LQALEPLICKRRQRDLQARLRLPAPRWFPLEQALTPLPPADGNDHSHGTDDQADTGSLIQGTDDEAMASPPLPTLPAGFAYPLMAKQASGGYDGKGTVVLRSPEELEALLQRVNPENWLVEEMVRFDRELSLVASRDQSGAVAVFPLAETHQYNQICDWVLAPAEVEHGVLAYARNIAASLLTSLEYVGVLSIEFFYGPGGLLINELAPRTHNSGHFTIEATQTSQFEQQLRIVSGQAVGPTDLKVPGALMVNLLGFESGSADYRHQRDALAALPDAWLHWYGKADSRPGRKLGHLTLLLQGSTAEERQQEATTRLAQVRAIWPLPPSLNPTDLA
ncbi:MAG: ATP-grasp domain-containing protein, partial [Cyanobacteriota bacterium]